jgi:hypothetical protein
MSKTKVIILLLFLFSSLVFALEWKLIIEAVDKAYKAVGLKTPGYILTIIEKESGFGKDLGSNLGSKEENLNRCINMCYWTEEINKLDGKKLVYCFDKEKQEYTIKARTQWCNNQYSALERITSNLGLDINKVLFSPDFGIGYTQFQPTTWLQYNELKNKNPWNLEDSLYAAALKLKYDGINENEEGAIGEYNRNPKYYRDYLDKRKEWDQILDDTIFVYDCPSNNFSCALSVIKTNYPECTENDWSIKKKKECIKTKVAFQKEQKLAQKQNEAKTLAYEIQVLETKESTPPYIEKAQNLLSSLIDLFTGKQISSTNNQNNQTNSGQTSLNQQTNQQTNQQSKINEQKQEEKITYKEEKKEITISIKNKQTGEIKTTTLDLSNTTTSKSNTSTQTTSTLSLRQQTIPASTQVFNQTSYIGGGGGITIQKDKCDDYKNRNYPKIIINEIQFETASGTKDEFIELYNPNNEEIDLTCWKLEKYASKQNSTSTPTLTTLIPSSKFQGKIKPNGYFLITSSSTKEKYQGDLSYAESYSISENNVIILRKPNGEISDLVGYGGDKEKIYQYESLPFIARNFENKSLQRKNFQDTDDNSKDFWLHKPSPKNSTFTEPPRQDFINLTNIIIRNFNVTFTPYRVDSGTGSTEDGYFLNISFQEPNPEAEPSARFGTSPEVRLLYFGASSTNNYSYDLLISPNAHFPPPTSNLEDFGVTSTLPMPKFDGSTTSLSFEITKCPTTSTTYYFALFLKDDLDEENKSSLATSSTTLPEDLCNPEPTPTTQNKSIRILFSEIRIIEGTSTVGEYIELYNPNDFEVNLTDWRIEKINSKGNPQLFIAKSKFNNITIKPLSYLLLVNSSTLETITTTPDIVYALSYNLTNNNGLRLIDKDNKIVDEVCWGKIENYSNCKQDNPLDSNFSLNRKKTKNSTSENILNEYIETNNGQIYLGNAYDTNNPNEDFLYAQINPENSSITRLTIKDIQNFQVTNQGKIYNFTWFSPAYYDENLSYELSISTSSSSTFQTIASTTFKILENQTLSLNLCNLNIPSGTDLYFQLNFLSDNQILKTASTSAKMINCFDDITQSLKKINERPFYYGLPLMSYIGRDVAKFQILQDLNLKRIKIWFVNCAPNCHPEPPDFTLSVAIIKTNDSGWEINLPDPIQQEDILLAKSFPDIIVKRLDPNNIILIVESDPLLPLYKDTYIFLVINGSGLLPLAKIIFEGEVLP